MAHTLGVGPTTGVSGGGADDTVNATLVGTTAGRGILILVWYMDAAALTVSGVTIAGESAPSSAGAMIRITSPADYGVQIFYLGNNTGGGNKAIEATFSAAPDASGICVIEFAGGDTASWLGTGTVSATGSSSAPSVNITTATNNELVIGMVICNDSTQTPGTGYTAITLPNIFWYEEGQYNLDAGTAGVKAFDMALGGSANWGIFAASFKIAGGAAVTGAYYYHNQQ